MNGFISGREEIIFHNTLAGRDEAGCHPLNTVSGLQDALDSKVPKTYLNNYFLTKTTSSTATLSDNKPTINSENYLEILDTTNTVIDWNGTQKISISRVVQNELILDNTRAITLSISASASRNCELEVGARLLIVQNDISTPISSNQVIGTRTYSGDSNFTNVYNISFDIISDLLVEPTTFPIGSTLVIELFKRQTLPAPLTLRLFCGVTQGGGDRYSTASINTTATSINTNLIQDGAVTLPKLGNDVISYIGSGSDIDSYVPAGTYTIGEGGDFATIADAFTFLNNKFSNGVVDLQLLDGTHNVETLDVPDLVCSRLRILGNATDNTLTTINCLTRTRTTMLNFNVPLALTINDVTFTDTANASLGSATLVGLQNSWSVLKLGNKINITVNYNQAGSSMFVPAFGAIIHCYGVNFNAVGTSNCMVFHGWGTNASVQLNTSTLTVNTASRLIDVGGTACAYLTGNTLNLTNVTSTYNITTNQINNTGFTSGSVIYV